MADSKRKRIVDAVKARLEGIKVADGYETDFGLKVFPWRQRPFETHEFPALVFRDEDEATEVKNLRPPGGTHEHTLNFVVLGGVQFEASKTPEEVSEMLLKGIQDVTKAIGVDIRWGGLAEDTAPGTNNRNMEMEVKITGSFTMRFSIIYRTLAFNPVE